MKILLLGVAVVIAVHTSAGQVCTSLKNFLSQRKNGWTPAPLSRVKSSDGLLSCVKNCTVLPTCRSYRFHTTENTCILLDQYDEQLESQGENREIATTTKKPQEMCAQDDYTYLVTSRTCVKLYKQRKTWMQAMAFCRSLNGSLVFIKPQQKHKAIVNLLKNSQAVQVWIGAKFDHGTNKFLWNDGSRINSRAWSPGEPSTYRNRLIGGAPEDCVQLDKRKKYKINDEFCSHRTSFMCEVKLAPVS